MRATGRPLPFGKSELPPPDPPGDAYGSLRHKILLRQGRDALLPAHDKLVKAVCTSVILIKSKAYKKCVCAAMLQVCTGQQMPGRQGGSWECVWLLQFLL